MFPKQKNILVAAVAVNTCELYVFFSVINVALLRFFSGK